MAEEERVMVGHYWVVCPKGCTFKKKEHVVGFKELGRNKDGSLKTKDGFYYKLVCPKCGVELKKVAKKVRPKTKKEEEGIQTWPKQKRGRRKKDGQAK